MMGILEAQERESLVPAVAEFIAGRPHRLESLIGSHLTRIETDSVPLMYAFNVVRYCERSAWVEDPALIIKLLLKWNHIVELNNAVMRLQSGAPPKYHINNRVWDTCLLALDLPFLNRIKTRQAIEEFSYDLIQTIHPKPGVRVLVVKGPEKHGKSYTYKYIQYVNSIFAQLSFNIISIDFKTQVTTRFGPVELIENLLDQVNKNWESEISFPALDTQQPARWMLELARVLVDQIKVANLVKNSTSSWFIVLDGFDDQKVPRETIDLILILGSIAVGSQLAAESNDLVRLVLLGFQESIPNFLNRVRIDEIQPITREDIGLYFTRYAEYKGYSLEPAALNEMIDTVLVDDLDQRIDRTEKIAQKSLEIAMEVFPTL